MQFRNLKRQYEALKESIDAEISEVIETTSFISGAKVQELELQLANYVGVKHCITCANGTDALSLALMAWGIGPGDCVFVPDFTFFASAEVIAFSGATPIFVDVDLKTCNIDAEKLEVAIKKIKAEGGLNPKAIITVDLFGLPADYDVICPIASKYGLKILEDSAQGFGGAINGKRACSFGDIATTSFFPAKPLGCYGDGGAIFTNDDAIAEYLRSICVHGKGNCKYDNVRIGVNSRLDTLQAGILIPKLKAFIEYEVTAINTIAQKYTTALKDVVMTPGFDDKYYSSWAQYCIRLKDSEQRSGLQKYLKEKDIPTMVYYPKPLHQQEAFRSMHLEDKYPNTEKLCETILALPIDPYLTDEEIDYVTQAIIQYIQ